MTRINCIPVEELTDKHLIAEYREIPRVYKLANRKAQIPPYYTMGTGHVKFFYNKLGFVTIRFLSIVEEMKRRGFNPKYTTIPDGSVCDRTRGLWGDWEPTAEALKINRDRIAERLNRV